MDCAAPVITFERQLGEAPALQGGVVLFWPTSALAARSERLKRGWEERFLADEDLDPFSRGGPWAAE